MIRHRHLTHRFVELLPDRLDPGVLYVSMEYGTIAHSCCCGCGTDVYTPLTPTDWSMTYDGDAVSLHPSVGNWHQPCRSHYVVRKGKVIEAGPWSDEQIATERERDRAAKARHYGAGPPETTPTAPKAPVKPTGLLARLKKRVARWF
ncbi:hypothetical protein HCU64_12700 [Methylobacterium sp. C25]|uniref:DUF6527 family protein n=1 Tax=Methylobacterium sp. C25 TaxID=2721622 RepID=UPI001F40D8FF|nr:DUF6527 family protein [Methylobacterium sp. C25]MCE4224617.1 hypothetical protein [Methylobacterium sp. C25]